MNIKIHKVFMFLMCMVPVLGFGQTFTGMGNPQPIPVTGTGGFPCTGGPTESVATATGQGVIGTDVGITMVELDLTHTWDGDLDITLVSPAGTTLDLSSDNGTSLDNYTGTIFADGNPNITTGTAPFTGMFEPEGGTLNGTFAGETGDGDWTLSICDDAGGDSGTLNSFSITFSALCAITLDQTGPIMLTAEPGVCGAMFAVNADAPACTDPITNDFAGDDNAMDTGASGLFPVGTTTVTFTSGLATASIDVTVVDDQAPEFTNCPTDFTVNLAPGECEFLLTFDTTVTDNCPPATISLNQDAAWPPTPGGGIPCSNATIDQISYFRVFDVGASPVNLTSVDMAFETTDEATPVTVNAYALAAGADPMAPMLADLTLIGSDVFTPVLPNLTLGNYPVNIEGLSGQVVFEFDTEGTRAGGGMGNIFSMNFGETAPTFLIGCDATIPGLFADITNVDNFFAQGLIVQVNLESVINIEQTSALGNGDNVAIGTTTISYEATDAAGNVSTCTFAITVNEFANPIQSLACNDNVNISTDENCEITLSADIFLEGGPYGCYDNYEINIWPFGNEGAAIGPFTGSPSVAIPLGTHVAEVVDPNTGIACWGNFTVEDKVAPTLECANYTVNCLNEDAVPGSPSLVDGALEIGTVASVDNTVTETTFTVSEDLDLLDISITLESTHTWVGDLVVSVTSPAGVTVDLIDNLGGPGFGCAGNGLDLEFRDDAAQSYADLNGTCNNNPAAEGIFQALGGNVNDLLGGSTAGTWTVSVEDLAGGDGGDVTIGLAYTSYGQVGLPIPASATAISNGNGNYTVFGLDACGPATISYSDSYAGDDCADGTIIRSWIVTDAAGNVGEGCNDTITVERLGIEGISLPPSLIQLTCGSGTDPMDIVNFFDNPLTTDINLGPNCSIDVIERNEGIPFAYPHYFQLGCDNNLHPQPVDNNICNIYATFADQVIPACGVGCNGNVKVIRTWTLLDWCTNETVPFTQLIKAVDDEGPTFIVKDVTVSTDPWGCEANVTIPQPWELHDNCTDNVDYTVSGPAGVVIVGDSESGYVGLGAPKGVHTFTYTASDCCGNVTTAPITVTVFDGAAPVVVVKQNIVISLTSSATNNEGVAKLFAASVDNGSYDGCTGVKLEVRRDEDNCDVRGNDTYNADGHPQDGSPNPNSPSFDPDGGAYVKFCCDDITNAVVDVNGDGELDPGYVKVWLRVFDDGDMDGSFGSAGDNYNESWAYVKVEDKLAPAIVCPPDVTLTCDMDYTDLSMTGEANGFASCGGIGVEFNDIIVNLNTCNVGFVRRRWNIVGRSDIFCDQTITIEDLAGPDPTVSFSQVGDRTFPGCPDEISLGEPTWTGGPCDVIGYTVETDTFRFEDGACYKLINEYTVINWCTYEPNNPLWVETPDFSDGIVRHIQVIKITDETKPVIENCEDMMFAINDAADSDNDGNVCEAMITLTNVATDEGSANCPTGWLKWQVFVDLWGDGTDDLEYSSFLPTFDSQFNDTNGNGIPDVYLMPTSNGGTVSVSLPDIEGSMSNHKVTWKVTDGCNNVTTCSQDFMVVDKKAPTPYCVSLSTAVMEMSGEVELWAIDFNVGSFDNCSAEENLRYTFTDVAPEDDALYDPTQRSSARTFDCDDVANSPVEVSMYVWDEKGNADFCSVFLTIVDNNGACGNGSRVAGTAATEVGTPVSDVEVVISSGLSEYPKTDMTDAAGAYAFNQNPEGADYVVTANKDVDYLNGVSTLDLVKIQRHMLGLESLDSPYKLIAADINADNDLKANDLLQLRKLILGVITDLPTNDSWRFVDASQTLDMEVSLDAVNYEVEINGLSSVMNDQDVVAVKVGDVTNNASANLQDQAIEVRSAKTLEFVLENQEVTAGETVVVEFTSADFAEVYGYQFTMELNGLAFAGVEGGSVSMTDVNVGVLSRDVVTVSYNSGTAKTSSANEVVFAMTFVATENGAISNMIDVTSKVTGAEAYVGETLEVRDVVISTRGEITEVASSELFQNEPNPFKGQTVVSFNLAESAAATLTVFDVTGKVITKENIAGLRGYNAVTLNAETLGTSGVLYYTLESGEFTATKKMIIIE